MALTWKDLRDIIIFSQTCHKSMRPQIDPNIEDRKHAIWLLQGLVITAVTYAFDENQKGNVYGVSQQLRVIAEAIDLISYIEELPEDSRQLKAWFKEKIVSRGKSLPAEERAKRTGLTTEQVKTSDTLGKKITEFWAQFMHPTLRLARAHVSKQSYTFDYNRLYDEPSMSPEQFTTLFHTNRSMLLGCLLYF